MSHSSSRKGARNEAYPLAQRASQVRSCLNHVANRLGMKRAELIEKVLADTGVDLNYPENESDLMRAFDYFESL